MIALGMSCNEKEWWWGNKVSRMTKEAIVPEKKNQYT